MIRDIFHDIYALDLSTVIIIMIASIILWSGLGAIIKKRMKLICSILAAISIIAILYNTVFSRSGTDVETNFVPFSSFERAVANSEIYRSMLMNVFLFLPLGLALPFVIKGRATKKILVSALIGFMLSVTIETIQLFYSLGMVETDDVICNTLGILIGCSAYPLSLLWIKQINRYHSNNT